MPSDSSRRRNAHRAEESGTRMARLEDRIEILSSAMQSIVGSSGVSIEALRLLSSTSGSDGSPENSIGTKPSTSGGPTPSTNPSPLVQTHTDPLSPSQGASSPSESSPRRTVEDCLDFFRSRMLPCFPFINLTADMPAWELQENRPFLFQAILTVTTFSTEKRLVRVENLKRILFTSALLDVKSNIDLLLGLLTYLAWSTDPFLGRADLMSRLIILATSLVYDLRLFKPLPPDTILMMTMTQDQVYGSDQNPDGETVQNFMEKQRAVLACFVLSSKYA